MPTPRQHPHVEGVVDWRAQQSLRLLWDRVFDLQGRLQRSQGAVTDLSTTAEAQDASLATIRQDADDALAQVERAAGALGDLATGELSPGEPLTGPGSKGDPIIPMSDVPATIEANIKASLYHYGRTDYSYWATLIHQATGAPWQGGDAKWYAGWDAYMEQRMAPGDTGSADHALYPLAAVYTTPPPPGYPTGGWT